MENRLEKNFGDITVIQRFDYKCGVVNVAGKIVVPFGKYDWIDSFDSGLARVKIGTAPNNMVSSNKWGIINERGEEVLPVEYDNIWNFVGKNRFSTRVEKDGNRHEVYFHNLNSFLPIRFKEEYAMKDDDGYGSHYGDFAGTYVQDVAGWSDDVIYDALDGEPDAYWNID